MILHISQERAWKTAESAGTYRTESLDSDGFIHCSTPQQVLRPANEMFRGQDGLVLLYIDPDKVRPPIIYEDCYESGQTFPHIYGPLNTDAVLAVIPFPPQADGTFRLPAALVALLSARQPHQDMEVSLIRRDYPILEYDARPAAILEPGELLDAIDISEHCLLCFFQDVINAQYEAGRLKQVYRLRSEIGENPVYEMIVDGRRLVVAHAGVGAPLSAAFMEELIALGCRKVIACGGCGVLDGQIGLGHVLVPTTAVRDEGTSYHYLPPAREVEVSPQAIDAIVSILDSRHIAYSLGKTWTTDAPYRETLGKVALRKQEGCLAVEMETAALCAVAQFRGVLFGQLLYAGDDVSGLEWDHRDWQNQTVARQKLFDLAAAACLLL